MPAVGDVAKLTVAIPLAFVVEVAEPNDPEPPPADHVTLLPAIATGLPLTSPS